ncbi:MAG: SagB/ThcOx family dehydrogenase [Acidobacteriota bacterium]|nr:SagB/ThcOx family dehydrogenase [Acidobacteriota bacterium]
MPTSFNREIEETRRYHDSTSHSYWSVRSGGRELDWPNYPRPFKIYPQLDPIPLPREFPPTNLPALHPAITNAATSVQREPGILSGAKDPEATSTAHPSRPTLSELASLLYHAAGVTRRRAWPGGEIYFRAAACTGALYEIELYLVTGDLDALPAGIYHFSPADFALRRLREGDWRGVVAAATAAEPAISHAPVSIIATGIYWRNAWKYGARAYRHFGWDNGTIHANLLAMAAAHHVPACLVLGFEDEPINRLLGLDTEKEVALSILALGSGDPPVPAAPVEIPPLHLETVRYSPEEVDFPEMRAMHSSTFLTSQTEVTVWRVASMPETPPVAQPLLAAAGKITIPLPMPPQAQIDSQDAGHRSRVMGHEDSLETVITRRGSSRRFTQQPITLAQLSAALEFATRPIPADFLAPGERLNDLYIIANAVEGIDPGSYFFSRDPFGLELLKSGMFREEARYLGLEQALAGDAAAAIFFLADLDAILGRYGNRGYRAAQLEAGILGGRLYLASYAQHLGATGLTFYDDDVIAFFSPHAAAKAAIFLVAIGHAAKRLRTL